MLRRGAATFALVLFFLAWGAGGASAAGSQDLWPNGAAGSRANTEWRTSSYGGGLLLRRTLLKVFLNTGEVLDLGSSAIGQGSSDIIVWNPGLVTGPIGTEVRGRRGWSASGHHFARTPALCPVSLLRRPG